MGKLGKRRAKLLISICLSIGTIYTYISTFKGYSFEFNIFDTLIINIFLFTIFCFTTWFFTHFAKEKKLLYYISLFLSSTLVFILYNNAFGPSESCGQSIPEQIMFFDKKHKVTHSGYHYGFMDYGSRFIIHEYFFGIEKIVGVAENANNYYGKNFKLQLNIKGGIVEIGFLNYQNKPKIDTLYIHALE